MFDKMARKVAALGLAAILGTAAAGSTTLTDGNFDAQVFDSGKNAFIKFQAPWSVLLASSYWMCGCACVGVFDVTRSRIAILRHRACAEQALVSLKYMPAVAEFCFFLL